MLPADTEDHRLLRLYRHYLGEPSRSTDVFVGFALFFGGIALGLIGLVVFLASATVAASGPLVWPFREAAIVLGTVGLPALLVSIVVLLPVSHRALYTSLSGVAICLVGIGIFVTMYPQAWNVPGQDYSPYGITVYAGGLVLLVASTGAALVAHHLAVANSTAVDAAGPSEPEPGAVSVTDEEVRRDIDETVDAADLTWGGVERSEPRKLRLKETRDADIDVSGMDVTPEVKTDTGVDNSVAELRKLRGWQPKTERGEAADDQVEALKALRAQSAEDDTDSGWLQGVVDRLRGG